ncbi:MAG: hypothetical protein COW84_00080, partial [Gammaproteobacteria bacterium CG22_combo_CG10-13_8_21_14_all_40_8]
MNAIFKILIITVALFCLPACATNYSCLDILTKKQKELLKLTESNILERATLTLPHSENINDELEKAKDTGVIACIAIEFHLDEKDVITEFKILNSSYNRNIARNSLRTLRKYRFSEDLKNKNAVIVMEYTMEK